MNEPAAEETGPVSYQFRPVLYWLSGRELVSYLLLCHSPISVRACSNRSAHQQLTDMLTCHTSQQLAHSSVAWHKHIKTNDASVKEKTKERGVPRQLFSDKGGEEVLHCPSVIELGVSVL